MGKVDFSNIPFRQEAVKGMTYEEWLEKLKKETGKTPEDLYNHTMEQIDIRPLYTEDDYKDMNHLHFMAGVPPYLRGPYPTMYVTRPWTVRQYAGFSTAEESNRLPSPVSIAFVMASSFCCTTSLSRLARSFFKRSICA